MLEAVTGASYESYVRARIFTPLGMLHTYKELASVTSGLYTTVFLEDPRIIGVTLGAHF